MRTLHLQESISVGCVPLTFVVLVKEWLSGAIPYPPHTQSLDTPPLPGYLPPWYPTPRYPTAWITYLSPGKDMGPEIPYPWKEHGTREAYPQKDVTRNGPGTNDTLHPTPAPSPVNRHTSVKSLSSHNFVVGR